MAHPFGQILTQLRTRVDGLTQERLAHRIGYDAALLARMAGGKKDLTGPSGRMRVLAIIGVLIEDGALYSLDEANELLLAAGLHPLHAAFDVERRIIDQLSAKLVAPGMWPVMGDPVLAETSSASMKP